MSPRNRLLRPGKWRGHVNRRDHAIRVLLAGIHGPHRTRMMLAYLTHPEMLSEAYRVRIRTHAKFRRIHA